jgi:hypothetical protein
MNLAGYESLLWGQLQLWLGLTEAFQLQYTYWASLSTVYLCFVRFEVLTAVKMSVLVFSPEDGGSMFLQNAGICLKVHMVLVSRI